MLSKSSFIYKLIYPISRGWFYLFSLFIILLFCVTPNAWGYAETTSETKAISVESTSTLAAITGASVAIERLIEFIWTCFTVFGAGTFGPWLPKIKQEIDNLTGDLTTAMQALTAEVTPVLGILNENVTKAKEALSEANKALNAAAAGSESHQAAQQQVADATAVLAQAQQAESTASSSSIATQAAAFLSSITALSQLPATSQNRQLLAAGASQKVNFLKAQLPALQAKAQVAEAAIDGLQSFLASFKDNPVRRLISLILGAIMGIATAVLFELDLFHALQLSYKDTTLHHMLTGLVIGLGASPTHEVIRLVQEYKESSKGQNAAKPNQPSDPKPTTT